MASMSDPPRGRNVAALTPGHPDADKLGVQTSIVSVWILVIPGVFLQITGSGLHNLVLFCLGTAVQGSGLWIHCGAKGRNRWWALLALAPIFGWI